MWQMYWRNIDPSVAEAIVAQLLRLTRGNQLYWTALGTKLRIAASGAWTFAMNTREFTELPALVAWKGGMAVVLVCDRQASRYPFSALMFALLSLLERQLPEHAVARLAGEDGKSAAERLEDEIAGYLERTEGETTIEALCGAMLRELWGWR